MSIFRGGIKKHETTPQEIPNPANGPEPTNPNEYIRRGYAYYTLGNYKEAEHDFSKAVSLDPKAIDAAYGLGMTLKAQHRMDEGVKAFRMAIDIIDSGVLENKVRGNMLRRLALGHVNEMTTGDWNLEKEIWHRIS
jgi:tetratricopeptide (TPR) repeat protein